jgi:hypothetical protein
MFDHLYGPGDGSFKPRHSKKRAPPIYAGGGGTPSTRSRSGFIAWSCAPQ